ncbi:MAG: hypothetical protein UY72_C0017G0010 [Candidatus Uhrbacteria bacterium GW2011_GWD2_52_7]|uniref:DUF5667 domain-containing protein n=1 Tax=Candidatus Uhrbacteria bacterium GW2011_GWD2_52_7 TaxID=1618989 RepID=A0A0G1ZPW7_9BACT|nr:MAG: hypothetical protein UY72_C0017G0010 [Candidatus Uhrbacteria bacterium GW2011_GWD2_52_7]
MTTCRYVSSYVTLPFPISPVSNLRQQLKALKNSSQAGAVSRSEHEAQKAKLLLAIGHEAQAVPAAVEPVSPVYFKWYLRNLVSRPIAISAAGFVLLTSGWMTTVSAAADSLPGDTLYSIKLVTERAQLQLASLDRKAVLHTEFAERRLDEVSALQGQVTGTVDPELVREAVDAYKSELASANANLAQLQASNESVTVEAAGDVQERISALEVKIDAAVNDTQSTVTAEVREVQESTRAASDAAVDVAVEAAEQEDVAAPDSEQSRAKLEEVFHREIGTLHGRQAFDLHRVETIKATMAEYAGVLNGALLPTSDALSLLRRNIDQATEAVPDAMKVFTKNDYRGAFDLLRDVDADLLAVEAALAEIEINIITAVSTYQQDQAAEDESNPGYTSAPEPTEETSGPFQSPLNQE